MFETDVPTPAAADSTRERLLEAAGEVFAERGFREATIREICRRAGANIASINYHFGGKERLYSDVIRYVDDAAMVRNPHVPPGPEQRTVEERLEWFVIQFMKKVFDTGRPAWHERLMAREMVEPTFALDELIDRNIKPRSIVLQAIVRDVLGPKATDEQVQRGAASVVGQCLFYWHCRPMIARLMPHVGFKPENVQALAAHISAFAIGGLEEMRVRIARQGGER
jgi:TetR/AcrR family transcriptional regulator, regulator of cefoperazone and chloramphenicol sensitivity